MLFQRGAPLQSVSSCFGGLGVYTMAAYLAGATTARMSST